MSLQTTDSSAKKTFFSIDADGGFHGMSRWPEAIRWLILLPFSMLCGVLAAWPIRFVMNALGPSISEGVIGSWFIAPIGAALIGGSMVAMASATAPRHRFFAGLAMAIIVAAIYGIVAVFALRNLAGWAVLASTAAAIITALWVAFSMRKHPSA